jgi:hypothetical protein
MSIPQPIKQGARLDFDTEWKQDRVEENVFIMANLLCVHTDAIERNEVLSDPSALKHLSSGFQISAAHACDSGYGDQNKR